MPPEFRYSLTRICLRTGQLSLSQRMAEIFPESGTFRALDTISDQEIELTVSEPRRVSGLAGFLDRHRLEVNDSIQVRRLVDGRIALTAVARKAKREFDEQAAIELIDSLVGEKPRTEAEIRALHPQIPADFPLYERLDSHPRLQMRGGRWVGVDVQASEASTIPSDPRESSTSDRTDSTRPVTGTGPIPEFDGTAASSQERRHGQAGRGSRAESRDQSRTEPRAEAHGRPLTEPQAEPHPTSGTGSRPESRPDSHTETRTESRTESRPDSRSGSDSERREERRSRDRSRAGRPAAVTPYPRGVLFPGEAALNSKRPAGDLKLVNRAREALIGFGYRVDGLPHGMLLARADLGRRQHSVLVRVLGDGERLDWAALLARRREHTADHLAVFGDHRDLHRLTAPAELARATLWSWDGIARVQNLAHTILVGPFDLEAHFVKGGMFGPGLQQFERSVGRMISEKGTLSAVITRLASLRPPAVFVLDDLVEGDLQREQVAKALELLSQAPFHLVARVDRGEYCLRHSVAQSLGHLSEYALSLTERLPGAKGRQPRSAEPGPDFQSDVSNEQNNLELAQEGKG